MASTGEVWKLGHRPALDGLRGIAVLLVVVGHLAPAGYIHATGQAGVTVFFVLSGFLIAALLLQERDRDGQIAITAFYIRRARRLLPALFVCVAVVAVVGVLVDGFVNWGVAVGAVSYTANWVRAAGVGKGTALSHTWSLSIEEQFYLVWPLVLGGLAPLSRRVRIAAVAVAATASAVTPVLLIDDGLGRIYYGSETRAMPLLLGCLLTMLLHGRPARRIPAAVTLPVVLVGLAGILAFDSPVFVVLGTPLMVGVWTAAVIWCVVQSDRSLVLTWPPLTLIGRRSYGLYLWHWPVILLVSRVTGDGFASLSLVAVPIMWALTVLSWRYVEAPFLRRSSSQKGAVDAVQGPLGGHRVADDDAIDVACEAVAATRALPHVEVASRGRVDRAR